MPCRYLAGLAGLAVTLMLSPAPDTLGATPLERQPVIAKRVAYLEPLALAAPASRANGFTLAPVGDFDGDGRTDVFATTRDAWQLSSGGRGAWRLLKKAAFDPATLRFGDFDGDGHADVFAVQPSNDGEAWSYSPDGRAPWKNLRLMTPAGSLVNGAAPANLPPPGEPLSSSTPDTISPPAPVMTDALRAILLAAHNEARANVSPAPTAPLAAMTWDAGLEAEAQAWADTCPTGHNSGRIYIDATGTHRPGENLAFRSGPFDPTIAAAMVGQWIGEHDNYDYAANACTPAGCGHYTQVVWQTSTRVGCGVQTACPDQFNNKLVCNYFTHGNFNGMRPYTLDGSAMPVPAPIGPPPAAPPAPSPVELTAMTDEVRALLLDFHNDARANVIPAPATPLPARQTSNRLGCAFRAECSVTGSLDRVLACNYMHHGNFGQQRPYTLDAAP